MTPEEIFQKSGLWRWFDSTPTQPYGTLDIDGLTHRGIDFANSFGTPVGVIEGGTVVYQDHHDNSLNDRVVVQSPSGYWEYQHIDSRVQKGDYIATGGIIGTINGLPVDTYSTGPHVHVQYARKWNSGKIWSSEWINPMPEIQQEKAEQVSTLPFSISRSGSTEVSMLNSNSINPNDVINGIVNISAGALAGDDPSTIAVNTLFSDQIQAIQDSVQKLMTIFIFLVIAVICIIGGLMILINKNPIRAAGIVKGTL